MASSCSPSVAAIEIRTDTWDTGFVLSVDALSFRKEAEVCAVSCPAARVASAREVSRLVEKVGCAVKTMP